MVIFLVLILASASRARTELLQQVGICHRVAVSGVDESEFKNAHGDVDQFVQSLALAKARSVSLKLLGGELGQSCQEEITSVLGCDSAFSFQGEILGKPKDSDEAKERWRKMSSKSGFLYTGHALLFRKNFTNSEAIDHFNGLVKGVIATRVEFSELTEKLIDVYVSTGEPLNCAGGFALDGVGAMFIKRIEGCYSNVIGLSLPWLREALAYCGKPFTRH